MRYGSMGRGLTVFVSSFLPSARVPSGGQKLVHAVLRERVGAGSVVLLAFCNERERGYVEANEFSDCRESTILSLSRGRRVAALLRYPRLPLAASARYFAAVDWFRRRLSAGDVSEVWMEFTQAAELLRWVPSTVATTLVVHDVLHQAMERRAESASGWRRGFYRWEARRTANWERQALRRPGRLLTLCEKDRVLIGELCGRADVEVRYPVVEARYRKVRREVARMDTSMMLFWGQMSRAENSDGVRWFVSTILPRIRRRHPGAKLVIAGAAPGPEVSALAGEGVEVLGYVEDPVPLFERARLAVVPLRLGSGIKIKVIEFMAARVPTVATKVGAEGVLPDPLLTVAEGEDEFAMRCCERLSGTASD